MNPSRILVPVLILAALATGGYWFFVHEADAPIAPLPNPTAIDQPEQPTDVAPPPEAVGETPTVLPDPGESQRTVAVVDNTNADAAQGVKGRVTLPTGMPAADTPLFLIESMMNDPIKVYILSKSGQAPPPVSSGRTGPDGTFALGVRDTSKSYDLRVASDMHPELSRQSIKVRDGDWYDTGDLKLAKGQIINGRVIDETTQGGVANALVFLNSGNQANTLLPTPGRERGVVAVTDGTGAFRFTSAPGDGLVNLVAEADGYAAGRLDNQPISAEKPYLIAISRGLPIAGVVVDGGGQPLSGVQVTAQGLSQKTPQSETTSTNSQGVFEFMSLREGPYELATNSAAYAAAKTPPVLAGDLEVKLVLVEKPWVKLMVRGSKGQEIKAYRLSLKRHFPNNPLGIGNVPEFPDRRVTPADYPSNLGGEWAVVRGLPAGDYVFQIEERSHAKSLSEPFTVRDGGEPAEVLALLTLGAAITGTVIDDQGKPVAGAIVSTDLNNSFEGSGGIFDLFRSMIPDRHTKTQEKTDRQGRFRMGMLAFADYMVRVSHPDYCQGSALDITLSQEGQVVDVGVIRLSRGTIVEGYTTVTGLAVGQIKVTLSLPNPGEPGGPVMEPGKPATAAQMFSASAISDNNGQYRLLKRVPPGTYKLVAARASADNNPFSILLDMRETERTVTLQPGQDRFKIDFDLPARPMTPASPMRQPTSYWDYIRVEQLLDLQRGIESDEAAVSDDEVRFIVIHQIDELWFKIVLRELAAVRGVFARDPVPEEAVADAVKRLRRAAICFDLAAAHFRLMETMQTQDYLTFRDKLSPASGFQSAQMREIEILMGLTDEARIPLGNEASYMDALRNADGSDSPAAARVRRRLEDLPTLKTAVDTWLRRTPIDGSRPGDPDDDQVTNRFIERYLAGHRTLCDRALEHAVGIQAMAPADEERLRARYRGQFEGASRHLLAEDVDAAERMAVRRLRAAILFVDSNRTLPLLSWPGQVIDALVECEQAMLVFRQRHARMVERVIGRRVGTGGSDGVAYLDATALRYRVFTEIWAARTLLLPPELCPEVADRAYYGLAAD